MFRRIPSRFLLVLPLFLVACTVGPDYQKPEGIAAASYKATGLKAPPPTGSWWSGFSDRKLSQLLSQAEKANPQARAALARLDQSRAILGLRRNDLLPSVTGQALATRQQDSTRDIFPIPPDPYSRYRATLNLNYEIDFWGRIRRSVRQQEALSQAAAADYITALLSTKAEIARDYLALRHLDDEIEVLENAIGLREKNERLVKSRLDAGDTTAIDYARAESQTETARADLFRVKQRRVELENAIAVLVGQNPSTFKIALAEPPRTPQVPAGVPADLLRRRPDVAATERRLAAAAEQIGITLADYLPRVALTATGGSAALSTSDLFQRNSRLWVISPTVDFPIVTFGRKDKAVAQAKAAYYEALENHRDSVLGAFRDVENALSGIANLDRALAAQRKATASAAEASRLVMLRFETGLSSFFEVIDAQREELLERRTLAQTEAARQLVTVQLIQALGGGWK